MDYTYLPHLHHLTKNIQKQLLPFENICQSILDVVFNLSSCLSFKVKTFIYKQSYPYLDEKNPNFSPELKAACIVWTWLYMNNLLHNNNEKLVRKILIKFYPDFNEHEQARILIIVRRNSSNINRKVKNELLDKVHDGSKESIENELQNYFMNNMQLPFLDENINQRSVELEAAINLWTHLNCQNLFNSLKINELREILDEIYSKSRLGVRASIRIISMVRSTI